MCVSFFWRIYPQSSTPQQSLITNFWPNAPENIDAAFESSQSDRVFLIKGNCSLFMFCCGIFMVCIHLVIYCVYFPFLVSDQRVWAFSGYDLVQGYPKSISSFGLPTTVKKIDAALHNPETGKTLFFVGTNYYRCVQTKSQIKSNGMFSFCVNRLTVSQNMLLTSRCFGAEADPHLN